MSDISTNPPKQGCLGVATELEMVLARGAGMFKKEEADAVRDGFICSAHLDELSRKWNFIQMRHQPSRVRNQQRVITCGFPACAFELTTGRDSTVTKDQAEAHLKYMGVLLHVGLRKISDFSRENLKLLQVFAPTTTRNWFSERSP